MLAADSLIDPGAAMAMRPRREFFPSGRRISTSTCCFSGGSRSPPLFSISLLSACMMLEQRPSPLRESLRRWVASCSFPVSSLGGRQIARLLACDSAPDFYKKKRRKVRGGYCHPDAACAFARASVSERDDRKFRKCPNLSIFAGHPAALGYC